MPRFSIVNQRLHNQGITCPYFDNPTNVVRSLTAVQAQDFLGSLWAIGLRTRGATEETIEGAIARKEIVRSWPMRGTLHLVASEDIRWMLRLLTPRVIARSQTRYREVELDAKVFHKSKKVIEKELLKEKYLTRAGLYHVLERSKIQTGDSRGLHIIGHLAQEGFICLGSRQGKQHTFVLLDEWIPTSRKLDRQSSIAELAIRYFSSHGPATQADFAWWTGLSPDDVRLAMTFAKESLHYEKINDLVYWFKEEHAVSRNSCYLLPSYDEYTVGYKDRSDFLDPKHAELARNGIFSPVLIQRGKIAGLWRREFRAKGVHLEIQTLGSNPSGLAKAVRQFGNFYNKESSYHASQLV